MLCGCTLMCNRCILPEPCIPWIEGERNRGDQGQKRPRSLEIAFQCSIPFSILHASNRGLVPFQFPIHSLCPLLEALQLVASREQHPRQQPQNSGLRSQGFVPRDCGRESAAMQSLSRGCGLGSLRSSTRCVRLAGRDRAEQRGVLLEISAVLHAGQHAQMVPDIPAIPYAQVPCGGAARACRALPGGPARRAPAAARPPPRPRPRAVCGCAGGRLLRCPRGVPRRRQEGDQAGVPL